MKHLRTRFLNSRNTHRRGDVLKGCLIATGVILVIAIAGIVFVVLNLKNWGANIAAGVAKVGIEAAAIPEDEKPELKLIIDDVRDRFKAGDITMDQLGTFFESLEDSALFVVGLSQIFENSYLAQSGLTDEEKAAGVISLQRYARGLADGTITQTMTSNIYDSLLTSDPNNPGSQTLKKPSEVTDDEVREVLTKAATEADAAGVSATPTPVDISDMLQAKVDAAFGAGGTSDSASGPSSSDENTDEAEAGTEAAP